MVASLKNSYIDWKLVSNHVDADCVISEFESPIKNSTRKYHLSVVVTPEGERRSYSVI